MRPGGSNGRTAKDRQERFYDLIADATRRVHKSQNLYWVDSNYSGAAAWSGRRLTAALPTLAAAEAKVVADQGDVILVSPFHAENLAVPLTFDTDYVRVEGLSIGNKKPIITMTAATTAITLSADNSEIKNIKFTTSGTIDVATPIVVSGNKNLIKDVDMYESATDSQFVYGILFTGLDCICDHLNFLGLAGDANVTGIRYTGADGLEIKNCRIVGNFQGVEDATGAIQCLTDEAIDLDIHHNRVENRDGTSEAGMVFDADCTGFVWENFIAVPTGDFGQGIVGDTLMRQYNNYVVDAATERGAPEGTASA